MPPRTAIFEFGTRNFVCKSCLASLRKRPTTIPQWPVRPLSQAATASKPPFARRTPEKDPERLRALEALGLLKETSDNPSVHYFEQDRRGKVRRLESAAEFEKGLNAHEELVESLEAIGERIQSAKEALDMEEKGNEEEATVAPDEAHDESEQLAASLLAIPISGLNGSRQTRIHKLNNWIRRCSRTTDKNTFLPKDIEGLWKTYLAARKTMNGRWKTVPGPAWEVLWQTLSADLPFNATRLLHVYTLSKDMHQAGVSLRPEQQVLVIEAMFVDGWEKEAIENHRRQVAALGANPDTFVQFWQLGLQMYSHVGDLERAERIANTLLESPHKIDPRFIYPFIKLCAETPAAVEKGFGLYRNLRDNLGDKMTIEDYDTIISFFLASENTDYALIIFVDMMKSGSVDLVGVTHYPPSIANPFFVGKWLKRLIGAGDLDGAYSVIRFMKARGIMPRPIQVNGLIGAWLRSGTAENVQRAEDVAWAMINTRVQFVELRRRFSSASGLNVLPLGDPWPRASLETFSLLAESFRERGLTAKMGPLWQSFQESEIAPNSFMLNQLLFSRLQEGGGDAVVTTYREMLKRFDLKPDSHTFMALWQALPANRLTRIHKRDLEKEATRTRALFAEMMRHVAAFKTPEGLEIDNFLARNILHSFRKIQDHAGLLLAYRAFRRLFRFNPPDMVIFELLIGTLDLQRVAKRREGSKLISARQSLEKYLAHRREELVATGDLKDQEELPPKTRAEISGDFLELQLETAFSDMTEEEAQKLMLETAEEMSLHS